MCDKAQRTQAFWNPSHTTWLQGLHVKLTIERENHLGELKM